MIWRSAVNILTALIRNALQKGHQCILLDYDTQWGWEWKCSCGEGASLMSTESRAMRDFHQHIEIRKVSA